MRGELPSMSRPMYETSLTGLPSSVHGITHNQVVRPSAFPNVFSLCRQQGLVTAAAAYQWMSELYSRPGRFDPMCNTIAQALLLNGQKTQFNIALGLCVGHDSLFYKYSDALVTTLAAKDRVLGHNPLAAIYCEEGYFKDRIL